MKREYALLTGLVFGIGIAGSWDPSFAFVMAGALSVTFVGYRLAWRRKAPLFAGRFQVPTSTHIDVRLIGGSAIFGIGWGIAGFCPDAAIPALVTGRWEVALFLAAVAVGFILRRLLSHVPVKATT